MKQFSIRKAYFYVAILLSVSICVEHGVNATIQETLNEMAENGATINDIFRPSENGSLGEGMIGFTYKGTLLKPFEIEVAMKFTLPQRNFGAEHELEMYSYLNAIHNTNVESYGIPTVYYYGRWGSYNLMAVSLLDPVFNNKMENGEVNYLDLLIVSREFVRIIKYIHSCGVLQNDIRLDNFMFRGDQAFIIAKKLYKNSHPEALPRRADEDEKRTAMEDWGCFVCSICEYVGVQFQWINRGNMHEIINGNQQSINSYIKEDLAKIAGIQHLGLKRVLVEFVKHVFNYNLIEGKRIRRRFSDGPRLSIYDQLYQIICGDISNIATTATVSWLGNDHGGYGMQNTTVDISTINDPFIVSQSYHHSAGSSSSRN